MVSTDEVLASPGGTAADRAPDNELVLTQAEWEPRAAEHRETVRRYTEPFRERRRRGETHPVEDFLFVYYQYSPAQLERWHPGAGVSLQVKSGTPAAAVWIDTDHYQCQADRVWCDPSTIHAKQKRQLVWIADLLRQTSERRGNFSCLGLHEWAMVYRARDVRHAASTPLRLPQKDIDALVESRPLTCTHFDAFRFFPPEARPLNRVTPTMESRPDLEQPACIHANMDLYKWAFKSMPWVGSDLLLECFLLAVDARQLDMRASPYDLSAYDGCDPICIETADGRAAYEQAQRAISSRAGPLRSKLEWRIREVIQLVETSSTQPAPV